MIYRVALDWNRPLHTLVALNPQPACRGLEYTREVPTASRVYLEGPFLSFAWNVIGDANGYVALLQQIGILNASHSPVTVLGPNDAYEETRYNAIALRPQVGVQMDRSNYFFRNITIHFINLEDLS